MGDEFYLPVLTVGQFGQEIRRLRRSSGVTQEELAAAAGVSRRWLSRFEGGHTGAEAGQVMKVVRAMGLAVRLGPQPVQR